MSKKPKDFIMPEPAGVQQQINRTLALVESIPRMLQSRRDRRDVPQGTHEQRKTIAMLLAHFKTNDYWEVTNIRDGYRRIQQWLQIEGLNNGSFRLVPSDSLESFAGSHSGDLFGLAYERRIYLLVEYYFAGASSVTLDIASSRVGGVAVPPLARTIVHEVCHIVFLYSVGGGASAWWYQSNPGYWRLPPRFFPDYFSTSSDGRCFCLVIFQLLLFTQVGKNRVREQFPLI